MDILGWGDVYGLILNRVRLSEMDFSDRLLKIDNEDEEKKNSFINKLISKVRHWVELVFEVWRNEKTRAHVWPYALVQGPQHAGS